MYEILKNYRDNKQLRDSFNALAEKTFGGLNFEYWYQNGFWGAHYNPYSIVVDGEVAANVSVNRTDMIIAGRRKKLYQLGTVMTDTRYRNRGLIRAIMAEIEKDTADADGVYLFGGDDVVEFYPKFGFRKGKEYLYTKKVDQNCPCTMANVPMKQPKDWNILAKAMGESTFQTGCEMVDNPGLIFFYVAQFMQENVYYSRELDAWAVAEIEEGSLMLHNIFSAKAITLDQVVAAFGGEIQSVTLGFAPADTEGWAVQDYHEEDCTFFVKGSCFEEFEARKLRIPSLSHA